MRKIFILCLILMSMNVNGEETRRVNPFLTPYVTPYGTVPFDKIEESDFLPALKEGFAREDAEIEAILSNQEDASFGNTIEPLEHSGELLERVQMVLYNLLSAESTDSLQAIAQEVAPMETEHHSKIMMNEKLFGRVKAVYEDHKNGKVKLDQEQQMLLQNTYDAFVASGANLNEKDKEVLKEINRELSLLSLQFGQNVLHATTGYQKVVTDKSKLDGLPEDLVEAAAERAKEKGQDGYLFDLTYPSYAPFMRYVKNRELRKELYMAYNTKAYGGENDNTEIVKKIVNLRLRKARLMGYADYASYALRHRMAENETNVYKLLDELLAAYRETADKERDEVANFARKTDGTNDLQAWDWSYYSNLLKEEKYSVSDSLVKPYFELERVKKGVFSLATTLYGLTFKENKTIPVYHEEVTAYEVYSGDEYMGILYTDFHPRAGKQGGAWMTEYKQQYRNADGSDSRPHISLVMNFTRPVGNKPSLLTMDEVQTFLHEFGHSLHGLLTRGTYASLSGTNVERDFVEMPSQFMENFAMEKQWLDTFAEHYETGEKVPVELVEKIRRSANFNCAYACLRQLSFGYLDMGWHTRTEEFDGDVAKTEKESWKKTLLLPEVEGTCMSVQFSHIFNGGYAAGYYGYKWAEVLDADAFSVFKEKGIFNKAVADSFRKNILEKGGSEKPMVLYKRFRGQEPTIDALLRRNGIKK